MNMKRMTTLLLILAGAYALLLVYLVAFQRHLMYYPEKTIGAPAQYGLTGFEDIRTQAADGTELQLWYRPARGGYPTIVYFHGNAGNIGHRAGIFATLADHGFGLLGLSYRGYGQSLGAPTETGLYHDARAALAYLVQNRSVPLSRILLYGESLGSGVAVQMATEYDVAGVVLEAPYTSTVNRAAEIYYYIPVKLLMRDRFDSLAKIGRVKAPLLLFHGERDAVIPAAHGRALLEAATALKRSFFFPETGHNDFDREAIAAHIADFSREHGLIAPQ
jgi:hypothetical protein